MYPDARGTVVTAGQRAYSGGMAYPVNEFEINRNEALAEIERKTGPSNFFRAMSDRPAVMLGVAQLYTSVMAPDSVSERIKELVYLAVSVVNECSYCSTHHEASAKRVGITDEEIEDIRSETDYRFSEPERAALRYARELTRTASADHETRDLLGAQFQPDQQMELTLAIALANFTNRVNNGMRIPLEKHKHLTA